MSEFESMSRDTKFDNDHCPVCGHYDPGCGGMDCFDKPRICGLNVKSYNISSKEERHLKTTNKSTVEYIDHMGNDDSVVNSARVSFDKVASLYTKEQNEKLIAYLARHNHWSPFAHTSITLRVHAPLFVARQLVKHQVGLVWNEVSRRYVDDEPVFFIPDEWREKPINVKQGSSSPLIDQGPIKEASWMASRYTLDAYNALLTMGVAPEQARMILPQNMMTTWYWTGSLLAFHRVYKQRTDPHAQQESLDVAIQIGEICSKLFQTSWKALLK